MTTDITSSELQFQISQAVNAHSLISITDSAGFITYVNNRFCEVCQYSQNELLKHTHKIINSNYHDHYFFKNMWQTISQGKIWRGRICNKKKDQSFYWVDSIIYPYVDQQGNGFNYISIRTLISNLVLTEERLNQSYAFSNIGILDRNLENNEIYLSENVRKFLGFDSKKHKIKTLELLNVVHKEDKTKLVEQLELSILKKTEYNTEFRIIWPDEQIRWIKEKGIVNYNPVGKAIRVLSMIQDITYQRNTEIELQRAKEKADEANSAKSRFLASMSHELRTPMNAIIGFTQLLQMDSDRPPSIEQLDNIMEILSAGHHLLQLIDEVLNLSEIESGKTNLIIRSVELGNILFECLSLSYPYISKMNITVEVYIEQQKTNQSELKGLELYVRADLIKLKQIILNLMSNGLKYNKPHGKLILVISRTKNHLIEIRVKDTGIGIEKEKQKLLFEPFNRLGAEFSDVEGTGIGLVITKQLVELMGCELQFKSQYKEGSEFWFTIPIEERRQSLRNGGNEIEIERRNQSNHIINNKKLLYVEDNASNLRLVSQIVSRLPQVSLYSAHNAELGFELANKYLPDLILLDLNLPGMSGLDVLKKLRKIPAMQSTPVIAISANAMPCEIEKALDAGFNSYITKPIDVSHFMVAIDKLLSR